MGYALSGYSGHHGDDFGDVSLIDCHSALVEFLFPTLLGLLQFGLKSFLLVTVVSRFFKVLGLYGLELVGLCFGNALLKFFYFFGSIHFSDVNAGAGFIHGINGFVGEKAVTDVSVGECHACS